MHLMREATFPSKFWYSEHLTYVTDQLFMLREKKKKLLPLASSQVFPQLTGPRVPVAYTTHVFVCYGNISIILVMHTYSPSSLRCIGAW